MLALRQTARRRIRPWSVIRASQHGVFNSYCSSSSPLAPPLQPVLYHQKHANSFSTTSPRSTRRRSFTSSVAAVEDDVEGSNDLTIEEQYSRKTPLEHVLLRPGMYVGACERLPPSPCWVLEESTNTDKPFRMARKDHGLVPALIKIFDEILVNASDNRLRDPKNCNHLDISIDPGSDSNSQQQPCIKIYNSGKGIPIRIHKEENMYVPELVFGNLMSGSNFQDDEKRLVGGVHGFGAKLTNIFSHSFTVETLDSQTQQKYQQTWYNNMTQATEPIIVKVAPSEEDYTCITFVPDIPRLTGIPDQTTIPEADYEIMCRRVVDVAGCHAKDLQVTLNGQDVSMASFEDYSQLYRSEDAPPLCFQTINARWEVGVGLSETGNFDSVSFVNGMSTHRGGTHINVIANQIIKRIQEVVEKQCDSDLAMIVTPSLIRRNLFVSVRALIENPMFDSQMKEYLTSSPDKFGSAYVLSKKFLNNALTQPIEEGGPGIVEEVIRLAQGRQQAMLLKEVGGKKTRRQLLSIPKLEDAHKAGSAVGNECTLILTEGDSAKALAVAGLEIIGRDLYGVFPLRGKFLNVREAKLSQLSSNAEVKALVAILGLDFDKEYETMEEREELRYGHVMLMTDQDNDGSHIKGLVINFFRHFWPKLLKPAIDQPTDFDSAKNETFLSSFVTPLLKVTRKGKGKETLSFFTVADYNQWRSSLADPKGLKNWNVKYYKGLGTSTPAEAREYFSAFDNHFRPFHWHSELDGEMIDMVFEKSGAAARRDWISETYDADSTLELEAENGNKVTYEDFVNKEMIHFSNADNIRSLPSAIDGLKPSQRKVLFAAFKRKLKSEIKVAQLSGYCAEHTAYHHGEVSLHSTIVGLAQDFVGSNNINLLVPSGQFGTRLTGGKDAASPRYIFTYLSPIARYLFPEEDDILLQHLEDDGQIIEPEYYCPILPMLLINGSQGIGTGWSTSIPSYDPEDVLAYIAAKLDGLEESPPIRPYARGFTGRIEAHADGRGFVTYGRAQQSSATSLTIDELPLNCWTDQYKQRLLKLQKGGEISSFVEDHTTTKVSFKVHMKGVQLKKKTRGGLETAFKLKSNLATTNMNAFDADGSIKKFESAEEIADAYFPVRLALYHDRKSMLQSEMKYETCLRRNKAEFIQAVVNGDIDLVGGQQSKAEITEQLKARGLSSSNDLIEIRNNNSVADRQRSQQDANDVEKEEREEGEPSGGFDYLLNMPLSSLTTEKIAQLKEDVANKESALAEIEKKTPADLWRVDLEKLAPHIRKLKASAQ